MRLREAAATPQKRERQKQHKRVCGEAAHGLCNTERATYLAANKARQRPRHTLEGCTELNHSHALHRATRRRARTDATQVFCALLSVYLESVSDCFSPLLFVSLSELIA